MTLQPWGTSPPWRAVSVCLLALVMTTCLTAATRLASIETAAMVTLAVTAWINAARP